MAFDEGLAERLRGVFDELAPAVEKRMFGGLAFMVDDKMCCGIIGDSLMIRVGPDQHEAALSRPHARPMDFTGRTMKGFIQVEPEGFESDRALREWVDGALRYVRTIDKRPAGKHRKAPSAAKKKR